MRHYIAYPGLAKISLGLLQENYGPEFLEWVNKRTDIHGTLQRPPYTLTHWSGWVKSLDGSRGKNEVFAVLEHVGTKKKPAYRHIGHMGVHHISWPDGCAETGSILGAPNVRGGGHGTEAKLLLLHHCFHVLGLRKLTSSVKAFNGNSLGHLIKCGYRICGRRTKQVFHEGAFVDEILLELHLEDFEPVWEKYQKTKKIPHLTDVQRALVKKEIDS